MATNTAGDAGQEYHTNQTHFLCKKITYSDNGTTVTVGSLPPYAVVTGGRVVVTTAFNGNSSNIVDVGTSDDGEDFGSDLALGTKGVIAFDETATALYAYSTSARNIIAAVTSTASASAGVAFVVVEYVINREG